MKSFARPRFMSGIDVLLSRHGNWLAGKRVGLVSHSAAVDRFGCLSAQRLGDERDVRLVCLFGPEHGFFGAAGAGVACGRAKHPSLRVPIVSLYGGADSPGKAMLKRLDMILFDIQDIAARPYTYVSTLRNVLEAACAAGKPVVVADRPVPLPRVVDGPVTDERFASFVAHVPAPMAYGMTPGETALWLRRVLGLDLDLKVARMRGYERQPGRDSDWPPWIPPSPGMRSWESAMCYIATVCFEALTTVDHGRATNLPFQVLGSPWIRGVEVAEALSAAGLPGVRFYHHAYAPNPGEKPGMILDGVRLTVTDPVRFRPVLTAVTLVHCLQVLYGKRRVWRISKERTRFFDKLFATDSVRLALLDGDAPWKIAETWRSGIVAYARARAQSLLYG